MILLLFLDLDLIAEREGMCIGPELRHVLDQRQQRHLCVSDLRQRRCDSETLIECVECCDDNMRGLVLSLAAGWLACGLGPSRSRTSVHGRLSIFVTDSCRISSFQ